MVKGKSSDNIVSFNAGELSPLMDARVDLEKYKAGCRQCQNMVVEIYGAARRRPGFQFIQPAKYPDVPSRMVDFRYSTTTSFIFEMGDGYLRFYSNGVRVVAPSGIKTTWMTSTGYSKGQYVTQLGSTYLCEIAHTSGTFATDLAAGKWILTTAYEIQTIYDAADVFAVQFTQVNDVMYLTHPDYPVQKLVRVADDSWTIAEAVFNVPALLDENLTTTTIAASSAAVGATVLTASAGIFLAGHVGSYWQIGHHRAAQSVAQVLTATGNTASIKVAAGAEWTIRSYGTWTATFLVERSVDNGSSWVAVRSFTGTDDRNVDTKGTEDEGALYRVNVSVWTSGTGRAVFEVPDAYVYGRVKITGYTNATTLAGTVVTALESTAASDIWSEGAWSAVRGYPAAATLHEQRLVFGGTNYEKQKAWGSKIGDFENIEQGTDDDAAFAYAIGAKQTNGIQWLNSGQALEIGTAGEEWIMSSGDEVSPISPTSVVAHRQSSLGSAALTALLTKDTTVFVQRAGLRLQEMTYTQDSNRYVSSDLTLFAEHITAGGIVQMAYQQQKQSVIWAVTGDGVLIGLTYEKDQGVVGWHRHVTDGLFESVATIPGDGADEVWVTVKRTVGDESVRYVERFNPVEWSEKQDCFFVDSGLSYNGSPSTVFSGLDHLEGKTVSILADGAVMPDQVVESGSVTLSVPATVVHVGLAFASILQPMRLDVDSNIGVSQGQVKRIRELTVRLYETLGLTYGDGTANRTYDLPFRSTSMPMDASPPLFTGDKRITFDGAFDTDTPLIIQQLQPLPLTVLGIVVKYEVTGN